MSDEAQPPHSSTPEAMSDGETAGLERGRYWAKFMVSWPQLKSLALASKKHVDDGVDLFRNADQRRTAGRDDASGSLLVLEMIYGKERAEAIAPGERAEKAQSMFDCADTEVSLDLAAGFVRGAVEVFDQIQSRLED